MATSQRKQVRATGTAQGSLGAINRFVVLMLENRSFDHMLGYMKRLNPAIAGMDETAFNYADPVNRLNPVPVRPCRATALDFDPRHEFEHVQEQLYGPAAGGGTNPPTNPAPMSGFVSSSASAGGPNVEKVMECFEPSQIPVFSALAAEFAIFNFWYSPIPGSTWPNRFFAHAGTSGGLSVSPRKLDIFNGFVFRNGTLYEKLEAKGKTWRIYHDDMPQALGVWWLRTKYLSSHFRHMGKFARDVASGHLPDYTFIEPRYDVFDDFVNGNSMHPHNDVGRGEELIKYVYETIRNSPLWQDTMLIVTFDEHGGFYDHVPPPRAAPTGDDAEYASAPPFAFDYYGVRVPTIAVSAYTDRGTVVGRDSSDAATIFDHSSIPATVRKRFQLDSLTDRERAAKTLDAALNRATPRTDAPTSLPQVARARPVRPRMRLALETKNRLTADQETFLALAAAVDRQINPQKRLSAAAAVEAKRTPAQARAYAARVQAQAMAMRGESTRAAGTPAKRAARPKKRGSKPAGRGRKTSRRRSATRRGKRGRG